MVMICLIGAAWALTAPSGWTQVGPDRAQRIEGAPGQGELLELAQPAGTGAPTDLSLLLVGAGMTAKQATVDARGRLNLVLADGRVGRASWDAAGSRWLVVLVEPAHAPKLDPDAVLLSAITAPPVVAASVWGVGSDAAPQPLEGGRDGSPWSAAATGAGGSWVDAGSLEPWAQDPALLGIWESSLVLNGAPAQLTFTFERDGTVRLERRVSGRTEHLAGRWSTRGGKLRLELPGSEGAEEYQAVGGTLNFRYDRVRMTLYRQ